MKMNQMEELGMERQHHVFVNDSIFNGIILDYVDGRIKTNAQWVVKHHNPTGMGYGYNGSGPADAALNIIENVLRGIEYAGAKIHDTWDGSVIFSLSMKLHQEFKRKFIASHKGGTINYFSVVRWIINNAGRDIISFRECEINGFGISNMPYPGSIKCQLDMFSNVYFYSLSIASLWLNSQNLPFMSLKKVEDE
jgi:hypothetical protein